MDDMEDGGDDGVYRGPTLAAVDEEEEQMLRNFGENKLMGRVQEALRVQLEDQLARLIEDLRETEQAREASRIHREDVGVQLYGVQQQLASWWSSQGPAGSRGRRTAGGAMPARAVEGECRDPQ